MTYDDRPDAAKRLEKARIAAGYESASDAAKRFGWAYATYSQHERGERGIVRAAKEYAKAFKVSEGWLLAGDVNQTGDKHLDELRSLFPKITESGREALLATARAMAGQDAEPSEESPLDPEPPSGAKVVRFRKERTTQ